MNEQVAISTSFANRPKSRLFLTFAAGWLLFAPSFGISIRIGPDEKSPRSLNVAHLMDAMKSKRRRLAI